MRHLLFLGLVFWAVKICQMQIHDKISFPVECKSLANEVVAEAKKAFDFIRKVICWQSKCKSSFRAVFEKYSPFVRDVILIEWIFDFLKKSNYDISETGLNVPSVYSEIAKKCIKENNQIYQIPNVCRAKTEDFGGLKECVVLRVMPYVANFTAWAGRACQIAKKENLVRKVFDPQFKPNWRKVVQDYPTSSLCGKQTKPN